VTTRAPEIDVGATAFAKEDTAHARPAETAGGDEESLDVERTDSTLHMGPGPAAENQAGDQLVQLLTPDQRRSRRKRDVRATTVSVKRMTKRQLEEGRLLYPTPDDAEPRPATRGVCEGGARPCPYVSCKHHLYLDVSQRTGAIKLNFPDLEVEDMTVSCALDIADENGATLERVGEVMNLTRERVRQLEQKGLDNGLRAVLKQLPELASEYTPAPGTEPRARTLWHVVKDDRRQRLTEKGLCNHCGKVPHRHGRRTCAECGRRATDAAIRSRDRRRQLVTGKPVSS
jgi:hypothetical protein